MCKRIHAYKRQHMAIFGFIFRYLALKKLSPEDRKHVVPRVSFFAGKAAPGYYIAKLMIRLISAGESLSVANLSSRRADKFAFAVSKTVQADPDMKDILQVVFLPDYSVSLAEIIIPANDTSNHISTAGTEASGTSNMKFALNGGLILGTADGANIEIAEEVGDENGEEPLRNETHDSLLTLNCTLVFFFGHLTPEVPALRRAHHFGETQYPAELLEVVDAIRSGLFGDSSVFEPLLHTIFEGGDECTFKHRLR